MKPIYLTLTLLFISCSFLFAQLSDVDKKELIRLDSILYTNYENGNFKAALEAAEQRLDYIKKHLPDVDSLYIPALNVAGTLYGANNQYNKAIPLIKAAYEKGKAYYEEDPSKLAPTINNLAVMYWRQEQYELAEPLYLEAYELLKNNGKENDPDMVRALGNIAALYQKMTYYEEALPYAQESIEKCEAILGKENKQYAISIRNLADCYYYLGRYTEAESAYQEAYNTWLKLNPKHPYFGYVLNNMAALYGKTKQYKKAITELERGLNLLEETIGKEDYNYMALLNNLANVYEQMGDLNEAMKITQSSLDLRKNKMGVRSVSYARELANMGMLYFKKEELQKGLEYLLDAKTILEEATDQKSQTYVKLLNNLAQVYQEMDSLESAETSLEKALSLNQFEEGQKEVLWPQEAMTSLDLLAKLEENKGNNSSLQAALNYRKEASNLMLKYKNQMLAAQDKLMVFQGYARRNKNALQTIEQLTAKKATDLGDEVLYFMDLNKSLLLADALKAQRAKTMGLVPDSLALKEANLEAALKKSNKQLLEVVDSTERMGLNKEKLALERELDALNQIYKKDYPDYFKRKTASDPIQMKALQAKLNKNQLVLEYLVTEESILLLLINQKDYQLLTLEMSQQELDAKIRDLRKCLSNYDFLNNSEEASKALYLKTAYWLYQHLFKGAEEDLSKYQELIIVPDGALGHIPFEALLTAKVSEELSYKELPYLLNKYSISYSYAIALWQENQQQNKRKNNSKLLACAASYESENTSHKSALRSPALRNLRKVLQALPAAQKEVESLSEGFEGSYLYGEMANETEFKKLASEFAVIHLAMHGLLNTQHPILSSLAFTENGDSLEDNFLQAYEISQLQLNADLVVLSACETGYGKFQQGEGVMSLARSFMYAGVPSLVVSLWQVNDASTAIIMQNFYKNLAQGLDKAKALQKAKLDYIALADDLVAHPAFWAPFIQLGDKQPVQIRQKGAGNILWWLIGGSGVVLVFIVIGLIRRRKIA